MKRGGRRNFSAEKYSGDGKVGIERSFKNLQLGFCKR
jgi:hypothetical protein